MALDALNSMYHSLYTSCFETDEATSVTSTALPLIAISLVAVPAIALAARVFSRMTTSELSLRPTSPVVDSHIQPPPTRAAFVAAVQRFETIHQVSLKDLLTGVAPQPTHTDIPVLDDPRKLELRIAFFNDPTIRNYLTRSSQFVCFQENQPDLIDNPHQLEESDHLECKIYQLICQNFSRLPHAPPYRRYVTTDQFYLTGTFDQGLFRTLPLSRAGLYRIYGENFSVDPDRFRNLIRMIDHGIPSPQALQYQENPFIFFSNTFENHSTTFVTILDKQSHRHLISIFINSEDRDSHYSHVRTHFNSRNELYEILLEGPECEGIHSRFSQKLADQTTLIDKTAREGYLLNPSQGFFINDPNEKSVYGALETGNIDLIHGLSLTGYRVTPVYAIQGGRLLHLINASHHLQIQPEDQNCTLYSLNFLQGIIQLVQKQEERLYDLAKKASFGSLAEQEEADQRLKHIFQIELRHHLPAYYDDFGHPRTDLAIKAHHLHQRWDLGAWGMHPDRLAASGYLPGKAL